MTKFVVSNIELIKKDYVVEAYTKEAAQEKAHLQPPRTKVSLGEITHSVTTINEYEYDRFWKDTMQGQKDWVGPNLWIHEHLEPNKSDRSLDFLDPDIGPDQLKDGYPEDSFRDLERSAPLWSPYEREGNGK